MESHCHRIFQSLSSKLLVLRYLLDALEFKLLSVEMLKIFKIIQVIILCIINIVAIPVLATAKETKEPEEIIAIHNDLKITLVDVFIWRDWQPVVSRPGKDGGSPLKVVSSFMFNNSKGDSKKTHWEAWLLLSGAESIYPIEIWNADSMLPWSGNLQAKEVKGVKLRTSSGPYLRVGDELTLVVRFIVDGEEIVIKSEPTEIMRTD
ncbi:MAG: hypothetical protein L3J22_06935 [Xanthomonadales bacterium]|nr:hypothetical protein [Xanthomonadales bacterium]